MNEQADLSETLPAPTPLHRTAIVSFVWGETVFHIMCAACSICKEPNPDDGRILDWLHCVGFQIGLYKYGEPEGPKKTMRFLIPAMYVMRIQHGPRYNRPTPTKSPDLGVFPPKHPAPDGALKMSEITEIMAWLQVRDGAKAPLLYDNYVREVCNRFEHALGQIRTEHNFEFGAEFEIAICRTLRTVLPQKYGICRGYVVSSLGEKAGDDIIIYDRMRFPTLRALEIDDYSRKEQVPIEAVYAYIEAKHSICIEGSGGNSFEKALSQVSRVKMLCDRRFPVPVGKAEEQPGWPPIRNPAYGIILARHVREKESGAPLDDPKEIRNRLLAAQVKTLRAPDICVFGRSNMFIPVVKQEGADATWMPSPFFIDGLSGIHSSVVDEVGFGAGLSILLWALEWIRLGEMPWAAILEDCIPPYIKDETGTEIGR